jgi:hypothetical protein
MKRLACQLLLCTALIWPSSAMAACSNADLVGNWRYFAYYTEEFFDGDLNILELTPVTIDCLLNLNFHSSGNFLRTTFVDCSGGDFPASFNEIFSEMFLAVGANCGLETCLTAQGILCQRGRLSRDKLTIHGTIRDLQEGQRGFFTMVKR